MCPQTQILSKSPWSHTGRKDLIVTCVTSLLEGVGLIIGARTANLSQDQSYGERTSQLILHCCLVLLCEVGGASSCTAVASLVPFGLHTRQVRLMLINVNLNIKTQLPKQLASLQIELEEAVCFL